MMARLTRRCLTRTRRLTTPTRTLARNAAATGNSAFLQDPIRSICGPVIFVTADGDDKNIDEVVEAVEHGIRAVKNYREDNPEEYNLWRAAVINSDKQV